jgi:glucan phosphoethanolaminetransferase (alkaline phosphatase superfamily)
MATPDVRAVHALRAFAQKKEPVVAGAVALPPLHSDRPAVPNVLFVLSESIRASDYVPETTPELRNLPGKRFDLKEMRAVSSYTAVSLSALLTARSQEAPRDDILKSPSLFDLARASRDQTMRGDARPFVGYFSAQLRDIFETKNVWAAADEMKALEDLVGKNLEEADQPTEELPLDRMVVDEMNTRLAKEKGAAMVVLHFGGTHAPYYCDPKNAPFQPVVHYASWRDMAMLHNAYKNAIHHQDRALAVAVRAFAERSQADGRPWMVVFTSDHGDAFAEHGAIHHGQNLYDEQVHVPGWILVGDGTLTAAQERALAEHEKKFVTHLDVLPTVLDAMGLWDNTAVAAHRAKMAGRSLLRPYEARGPIPVTNCTTMFPCPLNTWGVYEDDHKLVAHIWDGNWECLVSGDEEKIAPGGDTICPRLGEVSRRHFPLLPNGTPNR